MITTAQHVPDNQYRISTSPLYTTNLETCVGVALSAGETLGLWHCHGADIMRLNTSEPNAATLLQEFLTKVEQESKINRQQITGYVIGGDYDRKVPKHADQRYRHNHTMYDLVLKQGIKLPPKRDPTHLICSMRKSALVWHEGHQFHLKTDLHKELYTNPQDALRKLLESKNPH